MTLEDLKIMYENLSTEIEIWYRKIETLNVQDNVETHLIFSKNNNSETEISVVTPSYNASSFLPQLYHTLSEQTLARKTEWIIVDDNSTDRSFEFYESLRRDKSLGRVVVLKNARNMGAAFTLKRGFSLASSENITWISADDAYLSKDKLERDIQLLNQGFDVVFSEHSVIGSSVQEGKLFSVPSRLYKDKFHFIAELYFLNYLPGSSICIKKEVYNQIGGLNEFLVNVDGDFDMVVRLALLEKKIGFSNTIVFIRQHPNQTSKSLERMAIGTAVTRLSYIRFFKELGITNDIRDAFILQWFDKSFSIALKSQNFQIDDILRHAAWFEELTGVPYFSEFVIKILWNNFAQKHELYKKQLKNLSNLFMESPVFVKFKNEYKKMFL
ncbi:glycosyltransferase [Fervidobacterium pennivorans subsp. carthaginiensis]|uniref:glycosyltransferase family 2 protein n=1 Tax=Fervidobacterium pennivorans TaxID=93466 RepID=UPI00355C9546